MSRAREDADGQVSSCGKATCGDERPERGRRPEVAGVNRRKQQSGSKRVPRRSTRPSTRPRDGDIREKRPDAALDVLGAGDAQAREGVQRLHQQDQAPPDMLTGQSGARSHAQRRQLRSVATTELRREREQEAEAEHKKHNRVRTQIDHLSRMTTWIREPEQPGSGVTVAFSQRPSAKSGRERMT